MKIVSNTLLYKDGEQVLEGYFALDEAISGRRPAILISHPWAGRNDFVNNKARQMAELGYVGFALDMYGQGILGNTREECAALMDPFMEDRAYLIQRITAALNTLKLMPWVEDTKIAALGFCFGGLCVLDLARSGADIKGVISMHGLLDPQKNLPKQKIRAKILACHGHDDPMGTPEQVLAFENEMTQAGADWQVQVYGHTMHAFTNPMANDPDFGTVYNSLAEKRSWAACQSFLREVFSDT